MSWRIISVILIISAPLIIAQDDDKNFYNKRYDSIDVDTIFRSSRLLNNYVDCLLDKKPCPPEGKDLKRILPQALRSKCSRCTKIQKAKALDVITRLYYQHPSIYLSLAERYDPTGEYTRNFEQWYDTELNRPNSQIQLNEVPQKTRIPSTWITKTTATTTTEKLYPKTTTSRPTLRTLPSTIRMKFLPTESVPIAPIVTERLVTTVRTTPSSTTRQTTTVSTVKVIPLDREIDLSRQSINRQFDAPINQQTDSFTNQQFIPQQNQRVPEITNLIPPRPINPPASQFVSQLPLPQQPVTPAQVSSTFSTTELSSSIVTNPTTSSFRPQQIPSETGLLSSAGVSSISTVSTNGNIPAIQTPQISLFVPPASTVQAQAPSFSSDPIQQVSTPFNTQSSVVTSTFDTPLVRNSNIDIPRQPAGLLDPNFIDNFFVPRRGLIRRSVDEFLDTTRDVVRAIFRIY